MPKNQYKTAKKRPFSLKNIGVDKFVCGVDEAWRGAWAGPVVAACVIWKWKNPIQGVLKDSKKMSKKNREKTYEEICLLAKAGKLSYGIGIIENSSIDMDWIREANRLAMQKALFQIQAHDFRSTLLLIDGRDNYIFEISDLPKPQYIIRGDSIVPQIMTASIVAKVTRDKLMTEHEKIFSWYGFSRHKGYGTEVHQKALKKLGVSEIHRKSYAPIKLASLWKGL